MNKFAEKSNKAVLDSPTEDISWWNRPVFGKGSLFESLFRKFTKSEISENVLRFHAREMMNLRDLTKIIQSIDNEKFGSEEFLAFIKLKYLLGQQTGDYQELKRSITLLQLAIEAKDSFISIDQIELRFRGSKQQQFYEFIESLLTHYESPEAFREQLQEKLAKQILEVKTEEGKVALQSYAQHLDRLSQDELGLQLLSLFKTYKLADYSILRIISELIESLRTRDLRDTKGILSLVLINFEIFEKLKQIIGVKESQHRPENYALMIQYIGLSHRYQSSSLKFEELMVVMRKWMKPYLAVQGIREAHPDSEFKQPKGFTEPIPGIAIYEKYRKWLTDKRTGITYVDFGEGINSTSV